MVAVIATSLLFCIFWPLSRANSEDFFMGKVLSVNSARNEIEVAPEVLTGDNSVSSATEENVLVQSKVALPACVTTGSKIRLWGERLPDDITTFIATEIRGCRGGGCSDPTGVRSRLSRRGKHFRNTLRKSTTEDKNTGHKGQGSGGAHGGNGGDGNGNGGGR
jgi:hypothetical protein